MGVFGGQWWWSGSRGRCCAEELLVVGCWLLVLRWSEVFRETAALRSTKNQKPKTNNSLSVH
jgi:hypothetical protein